MYYVIELQTNGGNTAYLVDGYATREQAESKYHTVLAAAAVSAVEKHAAVILTEEGFLVESKCYKHPVVSEV